jgi:hypothetical protein
MRDFTGGNSPVTCAITTLALDGTLIGAWFLKADGIELAQGRAMMGILALMVPDQLGVSTHSQVGIIVCLLKQRQG